MGIITTYTDDAATTDDDRFLTSDASGTTKLTPASTLKDYILSDANIASFTWQNGTGTWTYASATTMTVPADDAANMSVGTKLKLTQTSVKYFYVVGVSGTTVTLTGGSSYTLVNAAITTPQYSNASSPPGFPGTLAWTPTWTSVSGGSLNFARFSMNGKSVDFRVKYTLAGAGVSGGIHFSLPVTPSGDYVASDPITGHGTFLDTGVARYEAAVLIGSPTTSVELRSITAGGSYTTSTGTSSTVPFTWGNTDTISATGNYEAA